MAESVGREFGANLGRRMASPTVLAITLVWTAAAGVGCGVVQQIIATKASECLSDPDSCSLMWRFAAWCAANPIVPTLVVMLGVPCVILVLQGRRAAREITEGRLRLIEQGLRSPAVPQPIALTVNIANPGPPPLVPASAPVVNHEPRVLMIGPAGPVNLAQEDFLNWLHINVVSLEREIIPGAKIWLRRNGDGPLLQMMWS